MFCNFCGTANPEAASFCSKCGKGIERTPPAAAVAAQPAAAQSTAARLIADVLQTPPAEPVAAPPSTAGSVTYVLQTPYAAAASAPAPVVAVAPVRQEAFAGALTPAARSEFVAAYTKEVGKQIDDKATPAGIAAWIITLIAVFRFNGVVALVLAFVAAGTVSAIVKSVLGNKLVRPIASMSDEMLVSRYNEAKADRRAARTLSTIGWAVIAIIVVIVVIAWVAARQ
jgi:predicted nucleic acid-binding Zn ribbon protein